MGVRNVPTVVCHGDLTNQCSETWRYWTGLPENNPLRDHIHYRLVEHEVGRPFKDFDNGAMFLKAMLDCVYAHEDAYTKARIIHRDISTGNILITYRIIRGQKRPFGMLND
ncbi:hypothetical protein B0H21DRAFT_766423 [Amylocystis lapponica]|nr:hypothetical protein B0H21DRAFT_766423 [Amylocystis lapponica]